LSEVGVLAGGREVVGLPPPVSVSLVWCSDEYVAVEVSSVVEAEVVVVVVREMLVAVSVPVVVVVVRESVTVAVVEVVVVWSVAVMEESERERVVLLVSVVLEVVVVVSVVVWATARPATRAERRREDLSCILEGVVAWVV
jgi:hypothetical protein